MGRLATLTRQIGWYVGSLMGDNHYDRYLRHRRRTHPDEPALCEADYWKVRHRAADRNPQGRCC